MESGYNADGEKTQHRGKMICIGIAPDHGGFELKAQLSAALNAEGYKVVDFGAHESNKEDDYPDFVAPLALAVAKGNVVKGIAICGSGVGACVATNKIAGVRTALITESYSAHQGVEDDNMNVVCLGGRATGYDLALELVSIFLKANYKAAERYKQRLKKVTALEKEKRN
ncbi:MAG: RpiB/LacA/LacB family sugar-phosphate isomerase [Ignavibacteriaceae bacterium]